MVLLPSECEPVSCLGYERAKTKRCLQLSECRREASWEPGLSSPLQTVLGKHPAEEEASSPQLAGI